MVVMVQTRECFFSNTVCHLCAFSRPIINEDLLTFHTCMNIFMKGFTNKKHCLSYGKATCFSMFVAYDGEY